MGTEMFFSAEQSFLFLFLCPLLLILTFQVSEVTGKKHFLIEVEDAETESTDADNGAVVGSEEEVDGDGQDYGLDGLDGQASEEDSKKKKGEVKVGAAEFQSHGADYGDSPVGEIPDLGADFKSAYVPVDASVPIILNEDNFQTGMNCPCFALRKCDEKKRKSKREKCVADCAKSC